MKFHFYTSDYKLGYPEVGWIPQLEIEPWKQWSDFHMEESPELILYQLNGIWTLYVSALDSGRKDYGQAIKHCCCCGFRLCEMEYCKAELYDQATERCAYKTRDFR